MARAMAARCGCPPDPFPRLLVGQLGVEPDELQCGSDATGDPIGAAHRQTPRPGRRRSGRGGGLRGGDPRQLTNEAPPPIRVLAGANPPERESDPVSPAQP